MGHEHHLIACCTRMSSLSFRPHRSLVTLHSLHHKHRGENLWAPLEVAEKGTARSCSAGFREQQMEPNESSSSAGAEGQDHQKGPGLVALPDDNDLETLEGQLNEVLNTAFVPEWWAAVRTSLERAVEAARSKDDLIAKRRLRTMVVGGVSKAQRNVKLWREMNALRAVVEEAVRARPPVSKVKDSFVVGLRIGEGVLQEAEEACHGHMGDALERIAKEDGKNNELGGGLANLMLDDNDGSHATSNGRRLFGARELRRLSHDSLWLLIGQAADHSAAQQKMLYLALCKLRELFYGETDGGKGRAQNTLSLETKERLKLAACAGHVQEVLLLLTIAHEGQRQQKQRQGEQGPPARHALDRSCQEEKGPFWGDQEKEREHDTAGQGQEQDSDASFTAMQSSNSTERDFLCPLTGTTLRQPVTLPCQHSFCKAALERYLVEQGEKWTAGGAAGASSDRSSISSSAGMIDDIRRCPLPQCRQKLPPGSFSINRALDENVQRFFPKHETVVAQSVISPGTKATVAQLMEGEGGDPIDALRTVGFTDEQISWALEAPPPAAAAADAADEEEEVDEVRRAVCQLLREDTTPASAPLQLLAASALSHSDLRRLNLDTLGCLIEALSRPPSSSSSSSSSSTYARTAYELLARIDSLFRDGEGVISPGMRQRLQRAVVEGKTGHVDTILRFLGASDLSSEVDVEVVLQDQLTGIILVDPVTLGCGHTFGKSALLRYLQRKPQTHRLCPLCNWSIPLDFQPIIDPLVSAILALSFHDKIMADLEAVQDAISTAPLVLTVMSSYAHQTDVLTKALFVLSRWAADGPRNRVVLHFHGAISPLLDVLRQHGRHRQLVTQAMEVLSVLAQDEGPALDMLQAGAVTVLLNDTTAGGREWWPPTVIQDVDRKRLRLLVRLMCCSGVMRPTSSSSSSSSSSSPLPLALTTGVALPQAKVVAVLEKHLASASASSLLLSPADVSGLLEALSRFVGPLWFTEQNHALVMSAAAAAAAGTDGSSLSSNSGGVGLGMLLIKFLERTLDAAGSVKDKRLARSMALHPSFSSLKDLLLGSPSTSTVALTTLMAQAALRLPPPPPMFFISHSNCTLQEGSGAIAATLGGEAGAEFGFGAYALGPVIPAGHTGAWEVKLVKEKRHDLDPTWSGEEFIVVGISTTASLAPDWSFFQKDKHRNPVAGINCSTGQVLVWGKTHAQYPPMASGDTIRVGVDLRGPRHFLVLHKHTPETPDRLLFRIALPERLERAYPAVIIFNRLSYTGRAFSAELSLTNPPPHFDFLAWMANAEVQERKRNGSAARGSRQMGAGSSSSSSSSGGEGADGGGAMGAGNRTPLKYLEPLPKAFYHLGELLTRTCRLGVHLQRVSSRGPFGLHKKGVHTYLFRPKHGKYHVMGLSDGTWGGFPPLPPVFCFGLEYHSTGIFRVLSSSGPTLERTLLPFACGGSGDGGEGAGSIEDEVKIEVTVFRAWDETAALPLVGGGELSSTTLDVSVFLNGKSLLTESLVVRTNPAGIRPFVGLVHEGDAISTVHVFSPLPVEAQTRWLCKCLATLDGLRKEEDGRASNKVEERGQHLDVKGRLERLAEILVAAPSNSSNDGAATPSSASSSLGKKKEVEACLEALLSDLEHTFKEEETMEALADVCVCQVLFRVLHAFPPTAPTTAPALLRYNTLGGLALEDGDDEEGEDDLSGNRLGGRSKGADVEQECVCRIVGLLWKVVGQVLVLQPSKQEAISRSLMDAGLVNAALHTLDTVATWRKGGEERRIGGPDDDGGSKQQQQQQQQQQQPYEVTLNVLTVLERVAAVGNPYHLHALTQNMTRLIKHAKFPRETQALPFSLDDMDAAAAAADADGETNNNSSNEEGDDDDKTHIIDVADSPEVQALQEAVRSKTLDLFLLLLRSFASFPPVARETLLVQRQVERLGKPLRLRLAAASAAAAAVAVAGGGSTDESERELVSALVGILASGDDHAWELAVWENNALGRCRTLMAPPLSPPASIEQQEKVQQEVESLLAKEMDPHAWASYTRAEWGPWGVVEHWQEALFGALLDGDVSWVVRILVGPGRWRTIREQPCFTSRRGPWAGMLHAELLPCSVVDAVEVLMEQARVAGRETGRFVRVREVLCVLEPLLQARETEEKLAFPDAPPLMASLPRSAADTLMYEKADRTMGLFNADAKVCLEAFGVQPGDRVRPRRSLSSFGSVIGACEQGRLWIHWDEDAGASYRSDDWCNVELEVVSRTREAPLTRASSTIIVPAGSSSSSSSSRGTGGLWPVFASSHLLEAGDDGTCTHQEILEGSRVTRGPTWKRGLEDGKPGNQGVVVRRSGDEVIVNWDGIAEQKSYRYAATPGGAHDVSWAFTVKDLVRCDAGMEVVRGPHWRFGQQDGGFYNPGRVVAVKCNYIVVRWAGVGGEEEDDEDEDEEEEEKDGEGDDGDEFDEEEEEEDADPSARPSLRREKRRRWKEYGYWYGSDYREVELLVRGCERLATIDSRKEHHLIDSQGMLVSALRALVKGGREDSIVQGMHLIACLAATPMSSVTYELLFTCRVHHLVHDVLAEPSASPPVRQAALRALIALLRGGRGPSYRLLLQESVTQRTSSGNSSSNDTHFVPLVLYVLASVSSTPTCKTLAAVALRHLAKGAAAAYHWDAKAALLAQLEASSSSVERVVNGLLEVLAAEFIVDVHVLLSCVYALADVAALWPAFRRALVRHRDPLLEALQRLTVIKEASLVVGAAVRLVVVELLGAEEGMLLAPQIAGLLTHVKDLRVYEALQPFKLLKACFSSSFSSSWTPQQHAHLLHASAAALTRDGETSAVLERVVVEDALDLYLVLLSEGISSISSSSNSSSSSIVLKESTVLPLAAACDALRLVLEATGSELYEELERRGVSNLLRTLLSDVLRPAATARQRATHVALTALLPSFFALLEVYSDVSHTCQTQDEERRQARASTNPLINTDFLPVIDPTWLQVSTGAASKLALLDNNPSTYWQSTERSHLPLTVVERRARGREGGVKTRVVPRPEVKGHIVTIRLPGASTAAAAAAAAVADDYDDEDDDDDDENLLVESGSSQPPRRVRVPPSSSASSSSSSSSLPPPEWTRLEVCRGMYGNFTPSEMWVLVKTNEGGGEGRKNEEKFVLVRRHLLREQDAAGWETLVERAELEALQQELGLTSIDSIYVEIIRNHGQGNNSRLSGLRFSCAEPLVVVDVVSPQAVLSLLQEYQGSGHHFLAAALSILQRTWGSHRVLEQLRYDEEAEEGEKEGRRPHIGSLVRCRWSRGESSHNAIVTAVRVLPPPLGGAQEQMVYDVQYFDHDSDRGRPPAALTPLGEARDNYLQAHKYIEEVVASHVREGREWSFFDRRQEDFPRAAGNQTTQQQQQQQQQQGASPRVAVSALTRGLGLSLPPVPPSLLLPSRFPVGGDFAQTGRQEVQRLRDALREAQTALASATMDEALRSSLEGQLGLYQQVVSAQEAQLLRHLQVGSSQQPGEEEEEEEEDEGGEEEEEEEDEEDFGDEEVDEDGMGGGEDGGY